MVVKAIFSWLKLLAAFAFGRQLVSLGLDPLLFPFKKKVEEVVEVLDRKTREVAGQKQRGIAQVVTRNELMILGGRSAGW